MISKFTWPNHDLPSDKDAVSRLMEGCGFDRDAAYGKTKVFIRTPRTLFSLEEQRADMVQRIVLFLQKVRTWALWVQLHADLSRNFNDICGKAVGFLRFVHSELRHESPLPPN